MTAEITTTVGQLSIYQGKWRNRAPNQVAVREPQSEDAPGAGKGDLFIITEIQGQAANLNALEQQLAQAIRDTYYLSRGSITASLRRALQAGSDLLYNYNQKSPAEAHVIGGVVVLVISNKDAFVAQLGPAALFAVLGDHIRRYPAQSPWLDNAATPNPDDEETAALGTTLIIEPNLHHLRIGPQDKLILADSRLARQLPLRKLVRAVDPGNVKMATKNLAEITQSPHCSAIVLEAMEAKTVGIGSLKIGGPKLSAPAQLSSWFQRRRRQAHREPVAVPQPVLEPTLEATEARAHTSATFSSTSVMQKPMQWLGALTPKPAPDIPDDEPVAPIPEPAAQYQRPKEKHPMPETTDDYATTMDSVAPESAYRPEFHSHEQSGETSVVKRFLQGIGVGLFMVVALLGNGLKSILNMLLPATNSGNNPRQAGAQAQRQPPSTSTLKLLRNVAIAIPILIILIVSISYLQKGRIREAEYNEFVTTAQQKFEQARAVDTTAALGLMTEAEAALIQAEEIKQDQPEIAELRVQMAEHADTIGNVHRLYYLPQRQYSDAGTTLDGIEVQGLDVYVMDTGNDRIFHHQLDDLGEALLPDEEGSLLMVARGQTVENTTVGDLLSMTWMPTGGNRQTSDLVILNSTGLLEYNPNWGITTSALAAGESLVLPVATDSFFGNFYLLDPQANKLLRYLPANDGYNLPPESYFPEDSPVNLSNAVDLSIDGAVYILYQDGRINKYLSGQLAEEFTVIGLDIPFNNPVAIYTAPDEEVQYIYVADAGNHRVVQLNKDGSFVRQFKPLAGEDVSFANLQDIYVDEIGGKMYILDSNNLYLTNIPTAEEELVE